MFYWRSREATADRVEAGQGGRIDPTAAPWAAFTDTEPPESPVAPRPTEPSAPTRPADARYAGAGVVGGVVGAGDAGDRTGEAGDFAGFNLGGLVGDDPARVERHRRQLAAAVGVPRERLLFMAQCHGADVAVVDAPWSGEAPAVDGLVTTRPDLALAVLVADCVPLLLADDTAGVVGAVHAGRPGMTAGIVSRALEAMRDVGAREVRAVVGPSVCGRCYEVPAAMRSAAAAVSPVSATVSWTGTPAIDIAAGVVDQLGRCGVHGVTWVPGCTRESPRLYSYRRRSRTGRFAGVVRRGA